MTRVTPASSQASTVAMPRMPPPSCTGSREPPPGWPAPPPRWPGGRRRRRPDRPHAPSRSRRAAKCGGLGGRGRRVDRGLRHVAALQPHHLPAFRSMAGRGSGSSSGRLQSRPRWAVMRLAGDRLARSAARHGPVPATCSSIRPATVAAVDPGIAGMGAPADVAERLEQRDGAVPGSPARRGSARAARWRRRVPRPAPSALPRQAEAAAHRGRCRRGSAGRRRPAPRCCAAGGPAARCRPRCRPAGR